MIGSEVVETSPGHPFYTSHGEWVEVQYLDPGDLIMNLELEYDTVESIEIVSQIYPKCNRPEE